jgi:serine protease
MKLLKLFTAAALTAVALNKPAPENNFDSVQAPATTNIIHNTPSANTRDVTTTNLKPTAETLKSSLQTTPSIMSRGSSQIFYHPAAVATPFPEQTVHGFIVTYRDQNTGMTPEREKDFDQEAERAGNKMQFSKTLPDGQHVLNFGTPVTGTNAAKLADKIKNTHPEIESIDANIRVELAQVTNPQDPYWPDMWHLRSIPGGANVQAAWPLVAQAHLQTAQRRSFDVRIRTPEHPGFTFAVQGPTAKPGVAIIDTGARLHEDLPTKINGYDFYDRDTNPIDKGDSCTGPTECNGGPDVPYNSFHGMHVQSIIAATTNNNVGVSGINDAIPVFHYRYYGQRSGYLSDYVAAISTAVNNSQVKVINLSQATNAPCPASLQNVLNRAASLNKTVVTAAGNTPGISSNNMFPANCRGVIAVAATSKYDMPTSYTSSGTVVTLSAPGGDMSTTPADGIVVASHDQFTGQVPEATIGRTYEYVQGTSFATPVVVGVITQMLSVNDKLTPTQIKDTLQITARPFAGTTNGMGNGIVDAFAAVTRARQITGGQMHIPKKPDCHNFPRLCQ